MRFLKDDINIDFLGKAKPAIIFSTILCVVSIVLFIARGEKNFGIDFTGGLLQQIEFNKQVKTEEVRAALKKENLQDASIQHLSEQNGVFLIRTSVESKEKVAKALTEGFPESKYTVSREEMVGPVVGKALRWQALLAILISIIGIVLYVSFRFEWEFGVASIIPLFHDVIITTGFLVVFQKEITLQVLAALLTIIGYSLNDNIVIFDRIREQLALTKGSKEPIEKLINRSVNQTLSRTILTSLTVLIVLIALFFFGGDVIHDFAFTMLVGVVFGCYSTIYVASPIVVYLKNKYGKKA